MTFRPVPVVELGRIKPTITGEPGRLIMASLANLVIDARYQRAFQEKNKKRVLDLVANWNWSLYTPIVVAPVTFDNGDGYAVIDGQYRSAAGLALRFEELPAWVTDADAILQAKAFIAINASPTRIDSLQLWHSRRAADDYDAVMLWDICTRAGVEISRYPIAAAYRDPHVTLCPGVLHELRQTIGKDLLLRTLQIVVAVGTSQKCSLITRNIMRTVARLVGTSWAELENDAIAAGLAQVDFAKVVAQAGADAKERGESVIDCLCAAINARLAEALSEEEQPEPERQRAKR